MLDPLAGARKREKNIGVYECSTRQQATTGLLQIVWYTQTDRHKADRQTNKSLAFVSDAIYHNITNIP